MKSWPDITLPYDILQKIANLTPFTRVTMGKANITADSLVTSQGLKHAEIWSAIFKDDKWIAKVMQLDYCMSANPEPCLMGKRMRTGNRKKNTDLILLINDWGGDARFMRNLFIESLQDFDPDEQDENLIHFKDSFISLHIQDAFGSSEGLTIKDLRKYVRTRRGKLSTYVSYYSDPNFVKLGPDDIGGIEGQESKEAIREVCCVKVRFREGRMIYRNFDNGELSTRLIPNMVQVDGRECVKSWRYA